MNKIQNNKLTVKRTPSAVLTFFLLGFLLLFNCQETQKKYAEASSAEGGKGEFIMKPFRVLIIIGDQWTDPQSYNIDARRVNGPDFIDVATMLKIWGVPFDVLRLDEQRLQINRFLDGEAKPDYGCIIWMADPEKIQGFSRNYHALKHAVNNYGISMIVLFDYIKAPEVARLSGINLHNITETQLVSKTDKLVISGDHFITSGLKGTVLPDGKLMAHSSIPQANGITDSIQNKLNDIQVIGLTNCTASDSATVLGKIGDNPQIVVRDLKNNAKVIWIGGGRDWFRKYPVMRDILRKALVYSIGYGVFNDTFENGFIFIMDDVGCSEHAWSLRWHYPTPSKDTLIKYLIKPLEKHGLMMVQNITPGYADPINKIIVSPWTVKPFRDIFGNWQDYGSTREGLAEGLEEESLRFRLTGPGHT